MSTSLYFPNVCGSDSKNSLFWSAILLDTSWTSVGTVTLRSNFTIGDTGVRGAFMVWMGYDATPDNLEVRIKVGENAPFSTGGFQLVSSEYRVNGTPFRVYKALWSTDLRLSPGQSVSAWWRAHTGELSLYNGVISVFATDWGDSADLARL